MTARRALGALFLALAFAAPHAAAAQTVNGPADALRALADTYFTAVANGDVSTIVNETTSTFFVISADGKRLSSDDFLRQISADYLLAMAPRGNSQNVRSTTVTPSGATQTVDTRRWFYGVASHDPMSGPTTEIDFASHQLTWVKSPDGRWLLAEDHVTSFTRT